MVKISAKANTSSEWTAASALRDKIIADFPKIQSSIGQDIWIFPSVKTPWHSETKDIDLYILAKFDPPLSFLDVDLVPRKCHSLSLSVEVKNHSASQVWVEGDAVWVNYDDGFKSATEQSYKQVFAIQSFYRRKGLGKAPFIRNFVWLFRVLSSEFERGQALPPDVIFYDSSFIQILQQCFSLQDGSRTNLSMFYDGFDFASAIESFAKVLVPTKLDRTRLENLSKKRFRHKSLERLGMAQLSFDGYGGAGKTATLLRIAKQSFEDGHRALILTYNTALTSDLYRQLSFLNLSQNAFGSSVRVDTLHAFFIRWLVELQEIERSWVDDDWFDREYFLAVQTAADKIRTGQIRISEIDEIKEAAPAEMKYSFVLVDEAQDWHDCERDLLYLLYDPKSLVLGIGNRQLVRNASPCNWTPPAPIQHSATHLKQCLRLKPNLACFVNNLAELLGDFDLRIESDSELSGGEIYIVVGSIARRRSFIADVIQKNLECGNNNIDLLFCVPRNNVNIEGGRRVSTLGKVLHSWHYEVYDASDRETRIGVPNSIDDLRVVSYESSRGLEGWAVFLDCFDEFFEQRILHYRQSIANNGTPLFLKDSLARRHALDWSLIPLTRAIDTLVISITDPTSLLGAALLALTIRFPDFVRLLER